ncbi:hypothetical protein HDK77DRAFT_210726 [Phyllosticta capitalensis]|uniref:uncharacterized protein n=1 Tax=Phyllosticta capitalensis TaxID=121624 RepID=UPI00313198D7
MSSRFPTITRALSPRDLGHCESLVDKCPLDNGRHNCNTSVEDPHLGDLEQLPLEVIQSILAKSDIRTLTDFRRVNRRAMQVVDNIPEYKAIIKHAASVLRTILCVEAAPFITCEDLHRELCQKECRSCGQVGGYIQLLTFEKICAVCISGPRFGGGFHHCTKYLPSPVTTTQVATWTQTMGKLPYIRSVSARGTKANGKILVNYADASLAFGEDEHWKVVQRKQVDEGTNDMRRQQARGTHWAQRLIWERMARLQWLQLGCRLRAVVRAPIIKPGATGAEWTFLCLGCKPNTRLLHSRPPFKFAEFVEDTFAGHLEEHGEVCIKSRGPLERPSYFHAKHAKGR